MTKKQKAAMDYLMQFRGKKIIQKKVPKGKRPMIIYFEYFNFDGRIIYREIHQVGFKPDIIKYLSACKVLPISYTSHNWELYEEKAS